MWNGDVGAAAFAPIKRRFLRSSGSGFFTENGSVLGHFLIKLSYSFDRMPSPYSNFAGRASLYSN